MKCIPKFLDLFEGEIISTKKQTKNKTIMFRFLLDDPEAFYQITVNGYLRRLVKIKPSKFHSEYIFNNLRYSPSFVRKINSYKEGIKYISERLLKIKFKNKYFLNSPNYISDYRDFIESLQEN